MPPRRHRSRRALAAAVAAAVALAGCGSSSDDERDLDSPSASLEVKIESLQRAVTAAPTDPEPLAELAKTRFQAAGLMRNSTGMYTEDGLRELRRATEAWDRYVALDPERLDTGVAQLIAAAYGPGSLEEPKKAVEIQQLVADNTRPPSAGPYAQLAQMAYYAGERATARRAAARAIELTPRAARDAMRKALAAASDQQP
ncbi:MAG: hypothetical protein ACLGI5_05625 [Thermoleophilia bacterium]